MKTAAFGRISTYWLSGLGALAIVLALVATLMMGGAASAETTKHGKVNVTKGQFAADCNTVGGTLENSGHTCDTGGGYHESCSFSTHTCWVTTPKLVRGDDSSVPKLPTVLDAVQAQSAVSDTTGQIDPTNPATTDQVDATVQVEQLVSVPAQAVQVDTAAQLQPGAISVQITPVAAPSDVNH